MLRFQVNVRLSEIRQLGVDDDTRGAIVIPALELNIGATVDADRKVAATLAVEQDRRDAILLVAKLIIHDDITHHKRARHELQDPRVANGSGARLGGVHGSVNAAHAAGDNLGHIELRAGLEGKTRERVILCDIVRRVDGPGGRENPGPRGLPGPMFTDADPVALAVHVHALVSKD